MSIYRFTTADPSHPDPAALADDELAALDRLTSADLLLDGDEGNIETEPEPEGLEPYTPEGPG